MSSAAAKKNDYKKDASERILDLQRKIYDANYIDGAIQRIAQVMSSRLVEMHNPHKEQWYVR